MADQRAQTKEIGQYILDACEDLTEDDIDCLVAHTNGPLREFFQKELDRREMVRVERHYEDHTSAESAADRVAYLNGSKVTA